MSGSRREVPPTTTSQPNPSHMDDEDGTENRSRLWYQGDIAELPIKPGQMTAEEVAAITEENSRRRRTLRLGFALSREFKERTKRNFVMGPWVPETPMSWPPKRPDSPPAPIIDQPPRYHEIRNHLVDRYQQLALDTMVSLIPEHTVHNYVG